MRTSDDLECGIDTNSNAASFTSNTTLVDPPRTSTLSVALGSLGLEAAQRMPYIIPEALGLTQPSHGFPTLRVIVD